MHRRIAATALGGVLVLGGGYVFLHNAFGFVLPTITFVVPTINWAAALAVVESDLGGLRWSVIWPALVVVAGLLILSRGRGTRVGSR